MINEDEALKVAEEAMKRMAEDLNRPYSKVKKTKEGRRHIQFTISNKKQVFDNLPKKLNKRDIKTLRRISMENVMRLFEAATILVENKFYGIASFLMILSAEEWGKYLLAEEMTSKELNQKEIKKFFESFFDHKIKHELFKKTVKDHPLTTTVREKEKHMSLYVNYSRHYNKFLPPSNDKSRCEFISYCLSEMFAELNKLTQALPV